MPASFGFFRYQAKPKAQIAYVERLLDKAVRARDRAVDLVVIPELALTRSQYRQLKETTAKHGAILIAGVAGEDRATGLSTNSFVVSAPVTGDPADYEQRKHHRWKLDKAQIKNYGLQNRLRNKEYLWEHIGIAERELLFLRVRPDLVVSALICEDLARQDPIGEVIRAVGPDLVICLLMDGPQCEERWSSRYSSVLADDPGSSVLTLTSAGMVKLDNRSRPKHLGSVALWRDRKTARPRVLKLSSDGRGFSLLLRLDSGEEWTADGRTDAGAAVFPVLEDAKELKD